MATLIFLLTFLTLFILIIRIIIKAIRKKPVKQALIIIGAIAASYFTLWLFFYFKSNNVAVPLGTDVCFDDWCATVTQTEMGPAVQKQFAPLHADSTWIILHVQMSNHARGIAQKPSEPRIHILDGQNQAYAYSIRGQELFESLKGNQPNLGQRLELHQSLTTALVFAVPAGAKDLKALIEEGPFITELLFPDDRSTFAVN